MTRRHTVSICASLIALVLLLTVSSCGSDPIAESAAPATEPVDSASPEPTTVTVSPEPTNPPAAEPAPAAPSGSEASGTDVDMGLFVDGALVGVPTTAPCTLSGGTESTCISLTIAGFPADGDIGPFCPRTTSDTEATVGIWFDGESLYDLNGQFILDLPEIYGDDAWQLHNDDGTVNVTDTVEAFEAAARPDVDPAYQNYCVEGQIAWLDGGQPITTTVEIPSIPVRSTSPTAVNGSVGVTLNGVIIDGQAPVDAILSAYTIAAFDDCGGHVNPVAGYHIHGAAGCSEVGDAEAGDTPMFAYALDGFPIHSPLDDTQAAAANLDACNGHTTESGGYHYHAGRTESNAVLTCFVGETAASANGGRGQRPGGPPPGATDDAQAPDTSPAASVAVYDEPQQASDYLGNYSLIDETFGTMVSVTVDSTTRTIVANSLPDHDTGDFPNSGNPNTISEQSLVLNFPAEPVYVGAAGFAQMPGVAVNGVAFEPGTAETVDCASGESYRVEGLQDLFNLGMDFNNAHVQPTGQYHYHGIADLLVDTHAAGDDLVLVGFAADGFLMYHSQSNAYESSYQLAATPRTGTDCVGSRAIGSSTVDIDGTAPDGTYGSDWEYVGGSGDLDSCNGVEIDGAYAYLVTDEYPFVPRCLNGEFTRTGPGAAAGPPPGAEQQAGAGPNQGPGQPDFTEAAAALGVTVEELQAALGGPPPDFARAATTLGVTEAELLSLLPPPPGR